MRIFFCSIKLPLQNSVIHRIFTMNMGTSKTTSFTQEQNLLAVYAKALAHPARIAILQHLSQLNACMCGDLVEVLPLSQATVSQHLKELKNAGLIQGTIEGRNVCYCINLENWNQAKNILNKMMESVKQTDQCC